MAIVITCAVNRVVYWLSPNGLVSMSASSTVNALEVKVNHVVVDSDPESENTNNL